MLRNLKKKEGWISVEPYSEIKLTKKGIKEAKKLTYKHRVIEAFLKKLKVSDDVIHAEAHNLEHAFSFNTINKLNNFLGNPKNCPHGQKIIKA